MYSSLPTLIRLGLEHTLNLILPFQCAHCGILLHSRGLCGTCWRQLHFLNRASCHTCSFPLPLSPAFEDPPLSCSACVAHPPPFKKAHSVLVYDDKSRNLLLRFKHGKEFSLVPLFTNWLFQRGASLWGEIDLILPVPLHWTRLFSRTFNQAALLTRQLSQKTGIPHHPFLLKRVHRTPSQGHMRRSQRQDNVRHAFVVRSRFRPLLQEARILLVDDVYTSGATLQACARTLLQEGASSVSALTVARAGRPH